VQAGKKSVRASRTSRARGFMVFVEVSVATL